MTEKERAERLACAQAQKDAIRNARKTAQLARLLWPQAAEDDLHGKVEILQRRLAIAGQDAAAEMVASYAHSAAWRKVKHTQHISDEGDITQASWYKAGKTALKGVRGAVDVVNAVLDMASDIGDTDGVRRLVNAAYWAAKEMKESAEDSQADIPRIDDEGDACDLHSTLSACIDDLQDAKDFLIHWVEDHDCTITR